jgi:hypothetical protein
MQAVAAEFSGYAGLFCCSFGENSVARTFARPGSHRREQRLFFSNAVTRAEPFANIVDSKQQQRSSLPHDELIPLSGCDNLLSLPMARQRATGYFFGS